MERGTTIHLVATICKVCCKMPAVIGSCIITNVLLTYIHFPVWTKEHSQVWRKFKMNKPTYVFCFVSHFSIWILLLFFHLHILCRLHVVLCTNSMSPTCRSIPVTSKSWLRIKIHKLVKSCWLVRCTGSHHNMEETIRVMIITVKNLVVMLKVAGTRLE